MRAVLSEPVAHCDHCMSYFFLVGTKKGSCELV